MKIDQFSNRHIGISPIEEAEMLAACGAKSLDQLISETIPTEILLQELLPLPEAMSEREYLEHINELGNLNKNYTSYIGMGWYDAITPSVILRNVLENPVWYTSYTPYQAEISQGRLEALLNYQTVITDLTQMEIANCSLLDEATAAAEAVTMLFNSRSREQVKGSINKVFVDQNIFPQTIALIKTRMEPQGIIVEIGMAENINPTNGYFATVIQYPTAYGNVTDYTSFTAKMHESGIKVAVAADILSLTLLTPPGEWGADVVFGSTQRFGIPMYYGGPSAAFFATKEEYKRNMPGRIIGISVDRLGNRALRMALQTREQHIKREKATSNICTAQALLATMAGFYAVYHGAEGLKGIATRIHSFASQFNKDVATLGYTQKNQFFFDTLHISLPSNVQIESLRTKALEQHININYINDKELSISFDETTTLTDLNTLVSVFAAAAGKPFRGLSQCKEQIAIPECMVRTSEFLTDPVFSLFHTETEMMRYIKRLERKDISLIHSMISLGSCTMKLNAASELLYLSSPSWGCVHPYAPKEQTEGYNLLIKNLGEHICIITGFQGISFQPNSGAAGEYAGLMTIREYLKYKGEEHRNIVIMPASAHGTNPASAIQAGFDIVVAKSLENGDVDMDDLRAKVAQHSANLAAYMITYPSTHGIFESEIKEMIDLIHANGAQVYMDGANMNAQVGLTNPGTIGADVCHLNLHKTFAGPHGGGGPGEGPICVAEHLIPFLPTHPCITVNPICDKNNETTVSASPFGSAGILGITYGYIRLMGAQGLKRATQIAILNANYLTAKLKDSYGVLFTGKAGRVGHELILECRNIKAQSGISETDIAKRLMDFGYHAPTLSFPVAGTLMVEPTESECKAELDRFIETMGKIYAEVQQVIDGTYPKEDNPLVNAPHPEYEVVSDEWNHAYSRSVAAYPLEWIRSNKFWINVARVDNAYGDRNLVSSRNCCDFR